MLQSVGGGHPVRVRCSGLANVRVAQRHSGRKASAMTAMQMRLFEHAVVPGLQLAQHILQRSMAGYRRGMVTLESRSAAKLVFKMRRRSMHHGRGPRRTW